METKSNKKNRAILLTDFIIPMTFSSINFKGRKGNVKKANPDEKGEFVFTPYSEGGIHSLWVYEDELKFY